MATYDDSNNVKAFNVSRLPQKGVLVTTMNRKVWHSLTYIADKDGEIHFYDPNNGYITAINTIDSVALRAHDHDANYSKDVEIAIYKNNEKLWPTDDDWFIAKSSGANEEKSVYFPDLVGVEVSKGDAIRIVIHSCGDSDTIPSVLALNPQVDYTAIDYIRIDNEYAEKAPVQENKPQNNIQEDDHSEIEDVVVDLDDDTEEEVVVRRRKKKFIKTYKNGLSVWTYVIIGAVAVVVLASGAIVFIIIKRRKKARGGLSK